MSDVGKSDVKMDFDPDILNRPLEPGSGMPDLNSILKRVRDDRRDVPHASDATAGKADFIAAARRAAQAAASEVESQKRSSADSEEADAAKGGLFSRQRKPILLAIGAIMIAIAGLQLKSAFLDHPALSDVTASQAQPAEPVAIASNAPEVGPTELTAPLEASTRPELAASQPAPDSVASVIAAQQNTPSTIAATDASTPPTAIEPATVIPAVPVEAGPEPLRAAASNGDPKALFEIGDRYMDGRGLERDYAKAAEWYSVAAEQGFAPAQYRLGNFYEKGLGLTRDLAKAKTYYQLAAEQGNASAMHNLAVLFAAGTDGAPDNESAALWFAKAAELGVKDSQFNLAVLSAKGMGVQQNLEESYKWFALAANAGDKDAAQKRDEVAKAMPSEQLQRARAAVELWKPKPMNPDTNALQCSRGMAGEPGYNRFHRHGKGYSQCPAHPEQEWLRCRRFGRQDRQQDARCDHGIPEGQRIEADRQHRRRFRQEPSQEERISFSDTLPIKNTSYPIVATYGFAFEPVHGASLRQCLTAARREGKKP